MIARSIPGVTAYIFGCAPACPNEIAAGEVPPGPVAKAVGVIPPAPAADPFTDPGDPAMHPHCALGEVSFTRRWTIRPPVAAGLPFLVEGDGVAIALDVAHAAELHVQLGAALVTNMQLRMQQAGG